MKRIVFCGIIALVIFAAGISALAYTSSVADNIIKGIEQVEWDYASGDIESAKKAAEKVSREWEDFRSVHFLTIDNDHALEITMTLKRICSLLEREDEEALTECEVMLGLIELYVGEQRPNILNIL